MFKTSWEEKMTRIASHRLFNANSLVSKWHCFFCFVVVVVWNVSSPEMQNSFSYIVSINLPAQACSVHSVEADSMIQRCHHWKCSSEASR